MTVDLQYDRIRPADSSRAGVTIPVLDDGGAGVNARIALKGDGTTEASADVTAALAPERRIILPAGDYAVAQEYAVGSDRRLQIDGEGHESTIITRAGGNWLSVASGHVALANHTLRGMERALRLVGGGTVRQLILDRMRFEAATNGDGVTSVNQTAGTLDGAFVFGSRFIGGVSGFVPSLTNMRDVLVMGSMFRGMALRGINLGSNHAIHQPNWRRYTMIGCTFRDIVGTPSQRGRGILAYGEQMITLGCHFDHISGDPADCDGLYTKVKWGTHGHHVFRNSGNGQAFLTVKGRARLGPDEDGDEPPSPGAPQGYAHAHVGHMFICDPWYRAAFPGQVKGTRLQNEDVLLAYCYYEGFEESAIFTGSGIYNRVVIDLPRAFGNTSNRVISFVADGYAQKIFRPQIWGAGTSCVDVRSGSHAATTETDMEIRGGDFREAQTAVRVIPGNDDVLDVTIADSHIRTERLVVLQNNRAKRIALWRNDARLATGDANFLLLTLPAITPLEWDIEGNRWPVRTTTDAAWTDLLMFHLPANRTFPVKFTIAGVRADNGERLMIERRVLCRTDATDGYVEGTPLTVADIRSAGAATWGVRVSFGVDRRIRFQAQGAAGVTVRWTLEFDLRTT